MYMNIFVWLLSDDEVNQYLTPGLGAACGLNVLTRFPEEGLPDGDCRALVVDLDSLAPGPSALQRLVKELSGRLYSYPVAAFGYSLEDHQIMDLRAAGIHVFQHGLCPALFDAIAERTPHTDQRGFPMSTHRFVWLLSHDEVNQYLAQDLGAACGLNVPRAAGIHVFPHCLRPAVFAAIADQSSEGPSAGGTPAPPIQPSREPETCGMCPWGERPGHTSVRLDRHPSPDGRKP
jgi:hypothetical protein